MGPKVFKWNMLNMAMSFFLYVYSGRVKVSVFAVSLRLICTEWLRASTVQYGTIGNGKT